MRDITLHIEGHKPVPLDKGDAKKLADALWRLGEHQRASGGIVLTVDDKGSFSKLQSWYLAHCDGDWEHDDRVRINSLDNPGWRLWVNLADIELAGRELERVQVERSDAD